MANLNIRMKGIHLILFLLLFSGCEKDNIPEDLDYRDPYTGSFFFTSIKSVISMCYDSSSTCIDGWEVFSTDTTYRISDIIKHDSCQIEFQFANDNIGYYNGSPINLVIYPILNKDGELISTSDFAQPGIRTRDFRGNFCGKDTLEIYFEFGTGGMGAYYIYEILGIREN